MDITPIAAERMTREFYTRSVEDLAQGALESCLELCGQDPEHNIIVARDITDENYYECIVGFGSPLDVLDGTDCEDLIALAFLSHSENRHAIMTHERFARWSEGKPDRQGHLFMGDGCIDYRMLAVAALYADVMTLFREKLAAHQEVARITEEANIVAIPFE